MSFIDVDFPSFLLGFSVCLLTPLVDIIGVSIMHKRFEKNKTEEKNNG